MKVLLKQKKKLKIHNSFITSQYCKPSNLKHRYLYGSVPHLYICLETPTIFTTASYFYNLQCFANVNLIFGLYDFIFRVEFIRDAKKEQELKKYAN